MAIKIDNRALDILEKAFVAEIEYALNKTGFGLIQTKSKLARELTSDGYLVERTTTLPCDLGSVSVKGYALTLLGNATYCLSNRCAEDAE